MFLFNSSPDITSNKKSSPKNHQETNKEKVTVDDIRNEFVKKFSNDASVWTEAQRAFSKKLNQLGNDGMKTMAKKEIDQTENIDALVKLPPKKIKQLREKLASL